MLSGTNRSIPDGTYVWTTANRYSEDETPLDTTPLAPEMLAMSGDDPRDTESAVRFLRRGEPLRLLVRRPMAHLDYEIAGGMNDAKVFDVPGQFVERGDELLLPSGLRLVPQDGAPIFAVRAHGLLRPVVLWPAQRVRKDGVHRDALKSADELIEPSVPADELEREALHVEGRFETAWPLFPFAALDAKPHALRTLRDVRLLGLDLVFLGTRACELELIGRRPRCELQLHTHGHVERVATAPPAYGRDAVP
jgi:hypothetical protein